MNPRFALKKATDAVHAELDELLSKLDLADRSDYSRFLLIQAAVVPPLEAALDALGMSRIVEDWDDHRRSGLLQSDLAELGCAMPEPVQIPPVETAAQALGAAYVMEGSRLGGQILARSVGPEMPGSFLFPNGHKRAWPALVAALTRDLDSPSLLEEAKGAASRTFGLFVGAARKNGLE